MSVSNLFLRRGALSRDPRALDINIFMGNIPSPILSRIRSCGARANYNIMTHICSAACPINALCPPNSEASCHCLWFAAHFSQVAPAPRGFQELEQMRNQNILYYQHLRHVRDIYKCTSDVVELLAASDFAGFFETSWPEHAVATM